MRTPYYEKYQLLIIERACSFNRSTGYDVEDLISQGNLIYCQVKNTHQNKRGVKFSTFLYTCLNNGLRNYIKKNNKYIKTTELTEKLMTKSGLLNKKSEARCNFLHVLTSLSNEAKHVIEIIIKSPMELLQLNGTEKPKAIRGKLYKHLRSKGWKWTTIWKTFNEIKSLTYNNQTWFNSNIFKT